MSMSWKAPETKESLLSPLDTLAGKKMNYLRKLPGFKPQTKCLLFDH